MPVVDMPLSELKEYKGTNPKPRDFDSYWETSVKEMHDIDPKIEIKPAALKSPVAECYDMYFTGAHGARIHARLLKPKNICGKCPAIVTFHGYGCVCEDWYSLLTWAASGFVVAAMDCRGQGGISQDVGGHDGNTLNGHIIRGLDNVDPKMLLYRDIFLDTAELADIIMSMPEVDENRVAAYGGSQGGGLTIACAALELRIKLAGVMYPFLSDYMRAWKTDMTEYAYAEVKQYFRNFDPRHEREKEIFTKLGYIDVHHLAPKIKAEVKMFTALMDNVCPPSTQFAAYNNMTCKKDLVVYPDFGHEFLPDAKEMMYEWFLSM